MAKQVVTSIETHCDICGTPIYGDSQPNKSIENVFLDSHSFNVAINIEIFDYNKKVNDLCPECYKKLLRTILDKWGG